MCKQDQPIWAQIPPGGVFGLLGVFDPHYLYRRRQYSCVFAYQSLYLQVFRTPKKGWGVRSWDSIPSGAPICEYIGLVRKTADLDPAADNSYVFDIDCLQTMKGLNGREVHNAFFN